MKLSPPSADRVASRTFDRLYPGIGVVTVEPVAAPPLKVEPLTRSSRGRKNTAAYNTHSYPTKVPAEAIAPYIEHHTRPGDLVLDPFAGSGMTGLAALRSGRQVILNDLSYGATHLAWNLCEPCDAAELAAAADSVLARTAEEFAELFATPGRGRRRGTIRWTLSSTVFRCPACDNRSSLWADATDKVRGQVAKAWPCGECGEVITKNASLAVGSEPAWMLVEDGQGRFERAPRPADRARLQRLEREGVAEWSPTLPLGPDREMYLRSALHLQGIRDVADFWTTRNRRALAVLWREIHSVNELRLRQALAFAFTNTAWHATRMRRYNARGGQRPLTGTLYIPQLSIEANPAFVFSNKIRPLLPLLLRAAA